MTIFNVSTAAELQDALSKATGGDEIRLAGGDYGELKLGSSAQFSSEVTITSADPGDPASFSSMRLNGAANITFDGVDFDYSYSSGDSSTYAPFQISGGSYNITLRNGEISGDNDSTGYPTGHGLYIRGSSDITIDNMEVSTWHRGIKLYQSEDITIINSEIYDISGDGLKISDTQGILIEGNYIHDFNADPASATHRDMIQVFTMGNDSPVTDLTIRNNVFDVGDGAWTQTIFMRNEEVDQGRAGEEMYYQNIVIENNVIYNSHTHGITVGETNGLVIRDNTVLFVETNQDLEVNTDRKSGVLTPKISVAEDSTSVTIEGNVIEAIRTDVQDGWNVNGNIYVQHTDPNASGYYGDVFISYAIGTEDGYNQYGVVKGSIIDQANAGSSLVDQYPMSYEDGVSTGSSSTGGNDAEESEDVTTGGAGDAETDGGTGTDTVEADDTGETGVDENTGADEDTAPETGGEDDSEAANDGAPNGPVTDADGFLAVFDDFVLNISAGLENNDQIMKVKGDVHVETDGVNAALVFNGDGEAIDLGRLTQFEQSERIAFTVEFAREEADGSKQRLVWNHQKVGLELVDDGLVVKVANTEAKFYQGFRIDDLGLNNTDAHRITVMVDQDTDHLQVLVDDMLVFEETNTDFDFVGAGGNEWGWMLGAPWGGTDPEGLMTDFRIDDDFAFVGDQVFDDALVG
jgi:hypothetical protein